MCYSARVLYCAVLYYTRLRAGVLVQYEYDKDILLHPILTLPNGTDSALPNLLNGSALAAYDLAPRSR